MSGKSRTTKKKDGMGASLSDVTYDLLEHMEKERAWMWLVVGVCLGLAPAVLFINVIILRYYLSRIVSPFILDLSAILGVVIAAIMIIIGIKQLIFLRHWQRKLTEVRKAERRLYEEVIESIKK